MLPGEPLDPNRRYLRITPGRGRAFLSHLDDAFYGAEDDDDDDNDVAAQGEEEEGGEGADAAAATKAPRARRFYMLHVLCRGQRFRSQPVPAAVEPDFGAPSSPSFTFDVQPDDCPPALLATPQQILAQPRGEQAVHIVLTLVTHRTRPSTTTSSSSTAPEVRTDVLGVHSLDWRTLFGEEDGAADVLVQLAPVGGSGSTASAASVPVGLLPLRLEVLPALPARSPLPASEVRARLDAGMQRAADASRAFFSYSKAWWGEYKALHPSFRRRLVKIFGEDEGADFGPLPSYVTPLSAGRAIDSPAAAARFVSLLPYRPPEAAYGVGAGASRREIWPSLHAVLAGKCAGAEGHVLLLASLLLGFGLDAYVAVGTRADASGREEEATWVVTRYSVPGGGDGEEGAAAGGFAPRSPRAGSPAGPGTARASSFASAALSSSSSSSSSSSYRVSCWDPLTGHRCAPGDVLPSGQCYARVACVFSSDRFYACAAEDDNVALMGWDLEGASGEWKGMDPAVLASLPHVQPVPVSPPTLDSAAVAVGLEAGLRAAVEDYRAGDEVRRHLTHARRAMGGAAESGVGAVDPAATAWDERLSVTLQQALAGYEAVRVFVLFCLSGGGGGGRGQVPVSLPAPVVCLVC
jgi:hypothetical protein